MKNTCRCAWRWFTVRLGGLFIVGTLCSGSTYAQLAITELMSDAATNQGPVRLETGSEVWELTNFGNTAIDLRDYTFADSLETPRVLLVRPGEEPLVIGPMESVIFVRSKETTNVAQFRDWWGSCLNTAVEVRMVPRTPGFDQVSDGLRVWDPALNLVDRVDFGVARRGVSFVSDPITGEFGALSEVGMCGSCRGATADDVGSPGVTCGPIPLRIVLQPASQ